MIDLRSDTVTQPTDKMRERMFSAKVGDDVYEDDETVKKLEEYASDLLGKEAALFVPSGTFGNQLALFTHTNRGDEVIVSHDSHILYHEVGAASVIAGVQLRSIECFGGRYDIKKLENSIREDDIHYPKTSLICVENAHGNGSVISTGKMSEIYDLSRKKEVPVHLDGARIFNAATSLGVDVKDIAKYADSVMFCLSKGLCAPVGSMLLGTKEFIEKARKKRKLMGGGLRQVGFLAEAGLVALEEMVERLKEDHDNIIYLADKLDKIEEIKIIRERLDINMVFFMLDESIIKENDFVSYLLNKGIKINGTEDGEYRLVTNNDISKENLDYVMKTIKECLS